jgi:hypothetical protein
VAPANLAQQLKVFEMARVLRLLTPPRLSELTGNNFGCFNSYTLFDTIRRRFLDDGGEGTYFAKQGRVLQIAFFANEDDVLFQEAFFFNFSPKGVQLADFRPDGRGTFKRLNEVERCVKFLQQFWALVYSGDDEEGPLPVGPSLDHLLERLDTEALLHVLSAEYVGAVIDMALRSLAATLDKPLPLTTKRTPRDWWRLITDRLQSLTFSRDNQDLFLHTQLRTPAVRTDKPGDKSTATIAAATVVTPAKPLPTDDNAICFTALRHHYQLPPGAAACEKGSGCLRVHPDGYKSLPMAAVVAQLGNLRGGDVSEVVRTVQKDTGMFRA